MIFKLIKFYTYCVKVLYLLIGTEKEILIHLNIISTAPKLGDSKRYISASNTFNRKLIAPLDSTHYKFTNTNDVSSTEQ